MKRFESKACLTSKRRRSRMIALSGALLMALGLSQTAADAYYYPFYYRGISSLLYPLRYATYPLLGMGGPYSSWTSNTPYRLATGRILPGYGYPYMYGPQMMRSYNDPEPLNNPRQRVKQQRAGQEVGVDESTHAQWADDQANGAPPQAVPGVQGATQGQLAGAPIGYPPGASTQGYPPAGQGYPPGATTYPPGTTSQGYPQGASQFALPPGYSTQPGVPPLNPDGSPQTAPPLVAKGGPVTLPPNLRDAALGSTPNEGHAPLADGFVNRINTQFQGNIEAALFDPATRKYARVLGLVSDDSLFGIDFTNTRKELVRQILADPSLDSVSKLGAIKILLTGGANRAKH